MSNPEEQTETRVDRMKKVAKWLAVPAACTVTAAYAGYAGYSIRKKMDDRMIEMLQDWCKQHMTYANKAEAFIDHKDLYTEFRNFVPPLDS